MKRRKIKLSSQKYFIPNAEIKYFFNKIRFFFQPQQNSFIFCSKIKVSSFNGITHEMEVEAAIISAALLGMTIFRRLNVFDRNC